MMNNKAIAKLINAKRLELEALNEMLPENVRVKKDELFGKIKSSVMEIAAELCKQGAAESGAANTAEKPHKVNINF